MLQAVLPLAEPGKRRVRERGGRGAIEIQQRTSEYVVYTRESDGAAMTGQSEYLCYTDGSCKAADGSPGGWGFVIKRAGAAPIEGYGKAHGTLAKIMEYRAVAEALAALPACAKAIVFCDNQSLVENLNKQLANWARCDFANVDRQIVDSARSINACITENRLVVRFQWLKAHNGNAGNERADELAAQGAREAKAELGARKRPPRR